MVRFSVRASASTLARRFSAIFMFVLALTAFTGVVYAQDDPVLTTDTALVQLSVGVVDKQGHPITNLSANDFAVFEDGVRRPILHFEPTDAPFSLVMLLDTSGSTITFRQQINQAAIRFLEALGPDDRVAVIDFNAKGPKLQLPFSTDRRRIAYIIGVTLQAGKGETPLYDALKYSLKELAREEPRRRKAIVVLTDGLDTEARNGDRAIVARASGAEVSSAIKPETNSQVVSVLNNADRQGVTIFPLALPSGDPKRLPLPDPVITGIYSAAHARLQNLADRTGGRLNEIQRLDQMARLYVEVAANLRTLYTVGYQPHSGRARDGKWHEIRVEVTQPELIARTKPGYFAR